MNPDRSLQRVIGVVVLIGGLWHATAPWIFGYSDVHSAVESDLVSGLSLALVGVAFVALGGSWILIGLAGAIGVWVLVAPQLLGNAGPRMTMLEATWGGLLLVVLMIIAALQRSSARITGARAIETGEHPTAT